MRRILFALLLVPAAATAQSAVSSLTGAWTVDLTVRPGDAPYTKQMRLDLAADGTVNGRFYDSEIQAGR